jgi:hypothetical protein
MKVFPSSLLSVVAVSLSVAAGRAGLILMDLRLVQRGPRWI